MEGNSTPLDAEKNKLFCNDVVVILKISQNLLSDLPQEDQDAIKNCVGKKFSIAGFDALGNVEVEFVDGQGNPHTIWIESNCVSKIKR